MKLSVCRILVRIYAGAFHFEGNEVYDTVPVNWMLQKDS